MKTLKVTALLVSWIYDPQLRYLSGVIQESSTEEVLPNGTWVEYNNVWSKSEYLLTASGPYNMFKIGSAGNIIYTFQAYHNEVFKL